MPCRWLWVMVPAVLFRVLAVGQVAEESTHTALEVKGAQPKTFYIDDRAGNNQVSIFSQSTLEDFTSVCNKVGGECRLNPRDLESLTGRFWLRVVDIKTGIPLRDTHMAGEDWLDTARYPEVVIKVTKVREVNKTAANAANMVLIGTCGLHGKTNEVRIRCSLTYLDESPQTMRRVKGDLVRFRAEFEVKLSDYGITGPTGSDAIGLKVADVLQLKATVFGSTEPPAQALEPDKGGAATQPSTRPSSRPSALEPPRRVTPKPADQK